MPRLAPSLFHHARRKNPLLPFLLRECRDLRSAENELRWLTEHASTTTLQRSPPYGQTQTVRRSNNGSTLLWRTTLRQLVRRRARGEPLQYVIGTQPFGDLEILCRRGVLIPRPETETYTAKLAELVRGLERREPAVDRQKKLRILDLCTGTGCISLLLHSLLRPPNDDRFGAGDGRDRPGLSLDVDILGIDISETALGLAKANLLYNVEHGHLHPSARDDVAFVRADVLGNSIKDSAVEKESPPDNTTAEHQTPKAGPGVEVPSVQELLQRPDLSGTKYDILIANPPYISPCQFSPGGTTARSVRRWEPQLALVPRPRHRPLESSSPVSLQHLTRRTAAEQESHHQLDKEERGDKFYTPLLDLAKSLGTKAVVLEVGDRMQACRVRELAARCFAGERDVVLEVWRDDGAVDTGTRTGTCTSDCVGGGRDGTESECRAVVVWRSSWAEWRTRMRMRGADKERQHI